MNKENGAIPLPNWLKSYQGTEFDCRRTKFLIRLAALYASENGTIGDLCDALGKKSQFFWAQVSEKNQRPLNPETAVLIEKLVGRDVITREELAPHVFVY